MVLFYSVCYSKVFHVRSVTQGDVIRADAKEIPKIFQVIYKLINILLCLIEASNVGKPV